MSITLKQVRRQVAGFSLAMMIATMFAIGVAQAATFTDVQPSDWFYPYVEDLAAQGILNTSFTAYRPADLVNRAEMAKLAVEAWNLTLETPTEAPFKDVPLGQWYTSYIYTAQKNNIVGGYKDNEGTLTGYFGPSDPLTREQAMKIISLAAPLTTNTKGGPHFPDVPVSRWSYEYVETGYNWSVVDGYPDGNFKPENQINRAEIAKMVSNAMSPVLRPGAGFNVEDALAMSSTEVQVCFSGEVGTGGDVAANYSIKDADGNDLAVSAAAAATDPMCVDLTTASQTEGKSYDLTVSGVMSAADEELDIADISFTGYSAIGTGGDLTCTAGADVPGIALPKGSSGVAMLELNCSANADPVVVTGLIFNRFGAGKYGDFSNVYLYDGAKRLTTGRSINSETNDVTFGGLNYTIDSGETVTFVVVADISGAAVASDQHAFQLVSKDDIESNAQSVDGTFPVKGNYFTISGASVGKVTVTKNGSLDDAVIGQTDARIAQFQLEASGTEAVKLERIALYTRGTCRSSDITNLKLYTEGGSEVLASTDAVGAKDLATFVLENPFQISQGQNKIFYVTADVACRNAETIKTYLDQTTDLLVTGVTFGTGVQVCSGAVAPCAGSYDGTGTNYSLVNVKGSKFNVSFAGPSATNVAIGQKGVAVFKINITNSAGEDVEIKDWKIKVENTNIPTAAGGLINTGDPLNPIANYTLIKLVKLDDAGKAVSTLLGPSELSLTGGDAQDVILSGNQFIKAGDTVKAAVVLDVASNPFMDNDKLKVTLYDLTGGYVKDMNGDVLTSSSVVPSANIAGNIMTISKAGLKAAIASTPTSRSYSRGTNDAALVGLSLTSGSSLDNTVKSLTLTGYVDANVDGTYVKGVDGGVFLKNIVDNNVALYDGSTKVSDYKNINDDGSLVFNNLSIAIAKSATKTLTLKGHISNSAPFVNPTNVIKFAIATTADMVVIDQDGQTVSTASIDVTAATNTGLTPLTANAADTKMTIISSGYGTTANTSTDKVYALASAVTTEVSRFKFTSINEDATLNNFKLAVLDGGAKSISDVKIYKNSSCDTLLGTYPVISGFVNVENLGLPLSSSTDTILCAKATNATVPNDGISEPLSGSHVGLGLMNITEVLSGSGENVTAKYVGGKFGNVAADFATLSGPLAAGAVPTVAGVLVPGDVLQIDGEMILVLTMGPPSVFTVAGGTFTTATTASAAEIATMSTGEAVGVTCVGGGGATYVTSVNPATLTITVPATGCTGPITAIARLNPAPATVIRGYGMTTDTSHTTGAVVTKSTIAGVIGGLVAGDVISDGLVPPSYAVCLTAGCGPGAQEKIAGPSVVPFPGVSYFKVHGPLSKLYRSVPLVTLNTLPSTILADGAVVSAFKITPDNSSVSFTTAVNHIIVNFSFGGGSTSGAGTCNLDEKGGATVATAAMPGAVTSGIIDFTTFVSSPYSISSAKDYEVKCNGMAIAGGGGQTMSTRFTVTGNPNGPVQWFDGVGVANIIDAGPALFPSDLGPQQLSN